MSIRIGQPTVKTYTEVDGNTPGASSVSGGTVIAFTTPQDCDNFAVRLRASVTGGGYSAIWQTSPDGGTTFYDVSRTSIVSNTGLAGGTQNAEWLTVGTISSGVRIVPSLIAAGSIVGVTGSIGRAAASTLANGTSSGMPIFSTNRVFLTCTTAITATSIVSVDIYANNQSATA